MRRRSGFTITELLVAMALIVFIMSIIATAFSEGMRTFRSLKAIGDLNQRLRQAASLLQDDLQAKHFEGDRRLSDLNFWTLGPPREGYFRIWHGSKIAARPAATALPPLPAFYTEGADNDFGLASVYATDHILQFTSKKLGNDQKNFYRTAVPPASPLANFGDFNSRFQDVPNATAATAEFTSQWAEIAWFLRATGQKANGTPLYNLHRRQRLVVANPASLNWPTPVVPATQYNVKAAGSGPGASDNYLNISCRVKGNGIYFNSPSDLTVPAYRFSMAPPNPAIPDTYSGMPAARNPITNYASCFAFQPLGTGNAQEEQTQPTLQGADVVLGDVISFCVRHRTTGAFIDPAATSATAGNPAFSGTTGPWVFDTWTNMNDGTVDYTAWNKSRATKNITFNPKSIPNTWVPAQTAGISALQIILRVWDSKTEQTRQITIVVDL